MPQGMIEASPECADFAMIETHAVFELLTVLSGFCQLSRIYLWTIRIRPRLKPSNFAARAPSVQQPFRSENRAMQSFAHPRAGLFGRPYALPPVSRGRFYP